MVLPKVSLRKPSSTELPCLRRKAASGICGTARKKPRVEGLGLGLGVQDLVNSYRFDCLTSETGFRCHSVTQDVA